MLKPRISVTESDPWSDGDPFADRVVSEIAARASSKPLAELVLEEAVLPDSNV